MYLFANWKMNLDKNQSNVLIDSMNQIFYKDERIIVSIFPPSISLGMIALNKTTNAYELGSQNISEYDQGAYTGEISARMVASFGCKYVLIGHSERRQMYNDFDSIIVKKIELALVNGLTPVLCVGETLQEYHNNYSKQRISNQIQSIISLTKKQNKQDIFNNIIIAYEPIWAIGTGLASSADYAEEMHFFIKGLLDSYNKNISVLYGGSVNIDNSLSLINKPSIDGFLVGGASLKGQDFFKIFQNML